MSAGTSSIVLLFLQSHASRYIEASKTRLYQTADQEAAIASRQVLVYVFDKVLKLLHPFMPFVTEELWQVGQVLSW